MEGSRDTFALLGRSFPVSGSKINWAEVPGARQVKATGEKAFPEECIDFWEHIARAEQLFGLVTYACDGDVDFSVEALAPNVSAVLRAALEIPQHHYLVGAGAAWCMCFTMEGDLDFGLNPTFAGPN